MKRVALGCCDLGISTAASGRGLIYPLTGSSWCTRPELIVALNQGGSIEVLQGLRIDFIPNSPRPFEEFARKISRIRKDAKSRGDRVLDSLAKEVGNSGYGKIAQAVASRRSIPDDVDSRRVFDVESALRAQSAVIRSVR